MQIKRDYSEPFFGERRRRRTSGRGLALALLMLIGGIVLLASTQFNQLRQVTYDLMGMSPTATLLPSDLATQAMALFAAGDVKGAAALFQQVVQQRPDDIHYLYEYGQLLIELDEPDKALQAANRVIDLNPNDPRGYALKAKALVWREDAAAAVPVALLGLQVNNEYAPLHSVLARAYIAIGRYRDALDAGKTAIDLDPLDADTHRSYAFALSSTGNSSLAIDQLEQAIALNPTWIPPYFELAYQYLALDQDQEAINTYDRVLTIQPHNAGALLRQCEAYRKVGQFERALGFCEDAVQADPTYTQAQLRLGILLYNRREFTQALALFEQCVANEPSNLDCQYRRGLAQYYLGECDQAWQILQDSLVMAQSRTGARAAIEDIRQGLVAITRDCAGYAGRYNALPGGS